MEITATRDKPYQELFVRSYDAKIASGLLDKDERLDHAKQLIDAAADLLVHDNKDVYNQLVDILNNL